MGEENLKVKEKEMKPGAEGKGPGPEGDKSAVSAKEVSNLDFILDIPLEISVELGRSESADQRTSAARSGVGD